MSFIRGGSNPEGMYIWADSAYVVTITHCVETPLASISHGNFSIPARSFYRVCRKWKEGSYDDPGIRYRGLSVTEQWALLNGKQEYLIRLAYKDDFVFMWDVTWKYIVNSVCSQ